MVICGYLNPKQTEVNSTRYENWFSKILPLLEDNSVIVLDNIPHHLRKKEKILRAFTPSSPKHK